MNHKIRATLEEFYNGATRCLLMDPLYIREGSWSDCRTVTFERKRSCVGCKGTGFKGGVRRRCQQCHGRGIVVTVMQYGPGVVQEIQTGCDACGGTGLDSNPMHYCQACCGAGEITEDRTLEVYIEQVTLTL